LIFDLDGTLIESNEANYDALEKAFKKLKLNLPINQEDIKLFYRMTH